jgi:hypothetical protein
MVWATGEVTVNLLRGITNVMEPSICGWTSESKCGRGQCLHACAAMCGLQHPMVLECSHKSMSEISRSGKLHEYTLCMYGVFAEGVD